MRLFRYLQHWLTGHGIRLQVAVFVPTTHPLRQWADTFPWAALVAAIEQSFAQRFPKDSTVAVLPSRLGCYWRWSCSSTKWALQKTLSVTACAPTLP